MELVLTRKWLTQQSTVGELAVNGKFECFILEDNYPTPYVKVFGQTCIPPGRYQVIVNHSPRFNMDMPLLCGVPGFEGVRIHPGNVAADTEGCLLTGRIRGVDSVSESRLAWFDLMPKIQAALANGETVHITIVVDPVQGA
jgi:Family of unknown function (DUF5675)